MTRWTARLLAVLGLLVMTAAVQAAPAQARGNGVCDFLRGQARSLCIQAQRSQAPQTQTRNQRQTQTQPQTPAQSQPQTRGSSAPAAPAGSYDENGFPAAISVGGFPRPNPARPPRVVQTCNTSDPKKNGQLMDACHNLVMFQVREAGEAFKTYCDQDDQIACHELAAEYFQKRIAPPAGKTSAEAGVFYDEKACRLGNAGACHNLGFAFRDNKELASRAGEALGYLEKACDWHGWQACYAVGDAYKFGNLDNDTALAYYQAACSYGSSGACVWTSANIASDCPAKRVERVNSVGHISIICMMPRGVPVSEYEVKVTGAEAAALAARENAPPEDALSKDPNVGLTLAEQSAIYHKPQAFADLCMKHNTRACYAIAAYTDLYKMSDIVGSEDDKAWTKVNSTPVVTALQQQCRTARTGPLNVDYCEAARTMDYAVASAFGGGDPGAHCLDVKGTGNTVDVYNVDNSGSKSYDHSETQATGVDLKNTCRFAIDIRLYGMDNEPATLAAGETKHTGPGFLGGLLNYNSLSIRWVKKH